MDYFRRTDRLDAILFGGLFLVFAAFLGFFGVRGAILFLRGSREAPADPTAFTIGILSAVALCYVTVRLWRRGSASRPLLPGPLLLLGSLAALGGMAWMMVLNYELYGSVLGDLRTVSAAGGIGVLGLVQWWRRVRKNGSSGKGNAA